jgi:Flp pilus assembly protein TadD
MKMGQFPLAIADFSAALSKNPKDAHSMYNRGAAKQIMGDQAGADADIAGARSLDPDVGK